MKHIAKNNYSREVTLLDEKTVRITERYDPDILFRYTIQQTYLPAEHNQYFPFLEYLNQNIPNIGLTNPLIAAFLCQQTLGIH